LLILPGEIVFADGAADMVARNVGKGLVAQPNRVLGRKVLTIVDVRSKPFCGFRMVKKN
jgi:hypothetical protein